MKEKKSRAGQELEILERLCNGKGASVAVIYINWHKKAEEGNGKGKSNGSMVQRRAWSFSVLGLAGWHGPWFRWWWRFTVRQTVPKKRSVRGPSSAESSRQEDPKKKTAAPRGRLLSRKRMEFTGLVYQFSPLFLASVSKQMHHPGRNVRCATEHAKAPIPTLSGEVRHIPPGALRKVFRAEVFRLCTVCEVLSAWLLS